MTTRIRACIVCHDVRRIRARNLCDMCHDRAWRTGRLDDYAPTKVDRMAQVRPLYEAGMPVADIAQQLGCSNYAVHAVVKRLRNENIAPSSVWESLTVPPAPDTVACTDAPPGLFDLYFHGGPGRTSVVRDGRLLQTYATQIEAAFRYCARCPLATRAWCRDEAVRPKQSHANIIAGGEVWVSGRRVWSIDEHDARQVGAA